MINDIIFCNSFVFKNLSFMNYKYTDNTAGININYFAYMTKGKAKLCTLDQETVYVNEGDIFYIPINTKYRSYWYGEPNIDFISLGFRFMPNFEKKIYKTQVLPKNETVVKLMQDIIKRETLDCTAIGEFYTLAGFLIPTMKHKSKSRSDELIDKVRYLISTDPCRTVRDIAKECAISESGLYSVFKKYSEKSINDIKKETLAEKSRELLIYTNRPIEEISGMLRFSSSAYFRKCFKDVYGITPREMRKKYGI